jgi:hypothetical protein
VRFHSVNASIENSLFKVPFHPDGSALPFVAKSLFNKTERARIRRALAPDAPGRLLNEADLSHLQSSFEIYDERRQQHQSGWKNPGSPIFAKQLWSKDEKTVGTGAHLRLRKSEAPRSARVRWTFPLPYLPYSGVGNRYAMWHVWASHLNAPFTHDWGTLVFTHGRCADVATEIVLPAITVYRADIDLGFTFFLDQEVPWITRIELDQRRHQIAFEFSHVGLTEHTEAKIALRFFCHRGCWRAGLAAIQERFPEATLPLSDRSRKYEGVMAYTVPGNKKILRSWRDKMDLTFNEILHFNDFGNYAPKEPWNCRNFWSPEASWRKADGLTWKKLRDYVRRCKDLEIGSFLYINFADCESKLARRRYADAIMRNEWGREIVTWVYPDRRRHCLMMNPDPQFGFSSEILRQAEEILERVPELDGFHLDQNGYGWIDTAHDDGSTMIDNRPAYNMLLGYRRVGKLFRQLCASKGKLIESNGLIHFRQLEDIDMLMAEGSLATLARYAPICSQRAVLFLATEEKGFQWSLKYGAFPHVSPYEWVPRPDLKIPAKTVEIYQSYLPVASLLKGATWVLEPNCLTLPRQEGDENYLGNITGNLFRLSDGNHLVTLLQAPLSVLNTGAVTRDFALRSSDDESFGRGQDNIQEGFAVEVCFASVTAVKSVRFLSSHREALSLKWARKGNRLRLIVPELGAFGAIHLISEKS